MMCSVLARHDALQCWAIGETLTSCADLRCRMLCVALAPFVWLQFWARCPGLPYHVNSQFRTMYITRIVPMKYHPRALDAALTLHEGYRYRVLSHVPTPCGTPRYHREDFLLEITCVVLTFRASFWGDHLRLVLRLRPLGIDRRPPVQRAARRHQSCPKL